MLREMKDDGESSVCSRCTLRQSGSNPDGWPGTGYIDQGEPQIHSDPPAYTWRVLGFWVYATTSTSAERFCASISE